MSWPVIFPNPASKNSRGVDIMMTTTNARFGLQAHQVFWNERGSIVCACCHIPYPGSDTWVWERWEEITSETMVEIDREGGHVACEGCGKEPRRIVR